MRKNPGPGPAARTFILIICLSAAGYGIFHLIAGIAAHNPHWILGGIAFPAIAISLAVMTLLGNKQG